MKVEKYEIPDELWYTKNHEWISVSKDKCTIGITDYAQESLHDIVYVELPKVGAKFKRGDTL